MKLIILIFSFVFCSVAFSQNALNFDGIDDYVSTTGTALTGNNPRSVEAWIRTTVNSTGNQNVILDWGTMFRGKRFTLNVLNNTLRLEIGGSGISGNLAINDGQWHHVAAVYNPNIPTGQIALYIDGALNTSGNLTQTINTSSLNNVTIGVRNDLTNHFEGEIDEVRIWNSARSATEIANHWNRHFCGGIPLGLITYYRFNQGVAADTNTGITSLTDYSLSGFTGTLHNFNLIGPNSNWVSGVGLSNGLAYGSMGASGCYNYISPSGKIIDSAGIYIDTVTYAIFCDSIITINVQIDTVDLSVITSSTTLQANQSGAAYQWLNCDNNYAPVAGAILQSFMPADASVNYAVRVTFNSCIDTSACVKLESGMSETEWIKASAISVYPNPTKGSVQLSFPQGTHAKVYVYSSTGQLVHQAEAQGQACNLQLQHLPGGVYSVQLVSAQFKVSKSLVLQK